MSQIVLRLYDWNWLLTVNYYGEFAQGVPRFSKSLSNSWNADFREHNIVFAYEVYVMYVDFDIYGCYTTKGDSPRNEQTCNVPNLIFRGGWAST